MNIDLDKMPKLGFGLMRLPEKDGVIDMYVKYDCFNRGVRMKEEADILDK